MKREIECCDLCGKILTIIDLIDDLCNSCSARLSQADSAQREAIRAKKPPLVALKEWKKQYT